MDEYKWLKSTDPLVMFEALQPTRSGDSSPIQMNGGYARVSDRKWRLFACACCRQAWDKLDEFSQDAVVHSEGYTDGLCRLMATEGVVSMKDKEILWWAGFVASGNVKTCEPSMRADLLRDVVGNPWHSYGTYPGLERNHIHITRNNQLVFEKLHAEMILALAQAAYNERDPHTGHLDPLRLSVLADALEEAGCQNEEFLRHLRGEQRYLYQATWSTDGPGYEGTIQEAWQPLRGPHIRGCWVIDAILGNE